MTMQAIAPNREAHLAKIRHKTNMVGQVGPQSKTIVVGLEVHKGRL